MIVRAKKEGEKMSPIQKGTKLTDNPKNVRLEIRLTQGENEMLSKCAEKLGVTRTDVIIKGIQKISEELA